MTGEHRVTYSQDSPWRDLELGWTPRQRGDALLTSERARRVVAVVPALMRTTFASSAGEIRTVLKFPSEAASSWARSRTSRFSSAATLLMGAPSWV